MESRYVLPIWNRYIPSFVFTRKTYKTHFHYFYENVIGLHKKNKLPEEFFNELSIAMQFALRESAMFIFMYLIKEKGLRMQTPVILTTLYIDRFLK